MTAPEESAAFPAYELYLALDDESIAVRAALVLHADVMRAALLVGNPAPIVRELADRVLHPMVGDLVVEHDAAYAVRHFYDSDWYRGFGILLGISGGQARVRYGPLPVDVCNWGNSTFYAVLLDRP